MQTVCMDPYVAQQIWANSLIGYSRHGFHEMSNRFKGVRSVPRYRVQTLTNTSQKQHYAHRYTKQFQHLQNPTFYEQSAYNSHKDEQKTSLKKQLIEDCSWTGGCLIEILK